MCSFYTTFYFFCSEHTRLTWLMKPLSLLHMAAVKPCWRKCVNGYKMQHKLFESKVMPISTQL